MWSHLEHLESSAVMWSHLESSGVIWSHLESSGVIWSHLESSGVIWNHLESPRRHPGDTQEAPRRHPGDTQETPRGTKGFRSRFGGPGLKNRYHPQLECQKFPSMFVLLNVFEGRITKHCKSFLLCGSRGRSAGPGKTPLIQHRKNPYR